MLAVAEEVDATGADTVVALVAGVALLLLGRVDADGYLWITGRAKDLIIRGGHNIDPAEIENALMSHPDVVGAAAIGQPDSFAGELPCVYVQLREGGTATEAELAAKLAQAEATIGSRKAAPGPVVLTVESWQAGVGLARRD